MSQRQTISGRVGQWLSEAKEWLLGPGSWKRIALLAVCVILIVLGIGALWIANLKIPDLQSFQTQQLTDSTKIYDRTGQVLLYDLNSNAKRQVVPFDQISGNLKNATVAIEDEKFYSNNGIELSSIARAFLVDVATLHFSQGGSTITQQVVKNSLLTDDKSIVRKIKEWVLALKLDHALSKDDILNLYLNSSPYGGNIYGAEEASQTYFGIHAANLDLAQAAYLAAMPQAPSYYSPYGDNVSELEARKNLVLQRMEQLGYITSDQYNEASNEKVTFLPQEDNSIKAPWFVMWIKDYLIQKYGEDEVDNGGLKVITTLDYTLQAQAEKIVSQYALSNVKKYNASNAGMMAIDPNTGQILVMVGSRNYFDPAIDGQFNVTTSHRQPGSAFKPFAYVTAFEKGYTPDTVIFDVPTQFSTTCDANGKPLVPNANCYMPVDYDGQWRGPISMRDALAQSINIPSIQVLYLAGITDTLTTAKDMGITSLGDANQYGLTLVLGGGEVSLLEMTSAYGDFATNGIRNPYTGILEVDDSSGNALEKFTPNPTQVLPLQPTLEINNVLSDNTARLPLNGPGAATDFPDREVALKTGTTNDYRDAWVIGYTPQIVVGVWAGNNDNTPMTHQISGLIAAPMWRAFMNIELASLPAVSFERPDPIDPTIKPVLRGIWQGDETYTIDKDSGLLATDLTPTDLREEIAIPDIHNILYWVDRSDPTGAPPTDPTQDPQYNLWEPPLQAWVAAHPSLVSATTPPTAYDNIHTAANEPAVSIVTPVQNAIFGSGNTITVNIQAHSVYPLAKAEFYLNDNLIGTENAPPYSFSFTPDSTQGFTAGPNQIKVIVYDSVENQGQAVVSLTINQ
jgi:1A family penicillin-binding protein